MIVVLYIALLVVGVPTACLSGSPEQIRRAQTVPNTYPMTPGRQHEVRG